MTERASRAQGGDLLRCASTSTHRPAVYTDWTAIALLLFTAVPLLIVVATATYFVIQNDQKTPLG